MFLLFFLCLLLLSFRITLFDDVTSSIVDVIQSDDVMTSHWDAFLIAERPENTKNDRK